MALGGELAATMTTDPENEPVLHDAAETFPSASVIEQIRQSLRGLRFGTVTVIVQDGLVVQIERTEKRRLRGPRRDKPDA
jgi:hypothetical protein